MPLSSRFRQELELLVCGDPTLDFADLELAARYEGFSAESSTVVNFWVSFIPSLFSF